MTYDAEVHVKNEASDDSYGLVNKCNTGKKWTNTDADYGAAVSDVTVTFSLVKSARAGF